RGSVRDAHAGSVGRCTGERCAGPGWRPKSPYRGSTRGRSPTRAFVLGPSAAAAVGTGDHLEQVAVGIPPVDTTTAVVVIDLTGTGEARIGPEVQAPFADAAEDRVELGLVDQKCVVLRGDVAIDLVVVQRDPVADLDHEERTEARRRRQPQHVG